MCKNSFVSEDATRLQAIPSMFALVRGKAGATYNSVFGEAASKIGDKEFELILTDFELGLFNGAKKNFKSKEIKCCWFHLNQAIIEILINWGSKPIMK